MLSAFFRTKRAKHRTDPPRQKKAKLCPVKRADRQENDGDENTEKILIEPLQNLHVCSLLLSRLFRGVSCLFFRLQKINVNDLLILEKRLDFSKK